MTATVVRADARDLPLPDASVDLIMCSPPFWQLRSYTDGGKHYDGQIGSEPTWQEYIANLLDCTREWVRVLKPEGNLFVELGDKYAGSGGNGNSGLLTPKYKGNVEAAPPSRGKRWGFPAKCLLDLPHRYAIRCVDDLGLIKRAEIVWNHTNGLPESATDRVKRAHSMVFHFTRFPRYYSAVDEIREPHVYPKDIRGEGWRRMANGATDHHSRSDPNPLGKLPGSVWSIPSQPLQVPAWLGIDHFAAYPLELPRRVVLGWSPAGVCVGCGQGRRPVRQYEVDDTGYFGEPIEERRTEPSGDIVRQIGQFIHDHRIRAGRSNSFDVTEEVTDRRTGAVANWEKGLSLPTPEHWRRLKQALCLPDTWDGVMLDTAMRPSVNGGGFEGSIERHVTASGRKSQRSPGKHITGYACACPQPDAPTRPAVVLDPFSGTGTTILVASVLGRHGIGTDLSADYCRLARWRTRDRGEIAKAMQVPKPPPVMDGQEALFPA